MAISTRRIGAIVPCPFCAADIVVPAADAVELPTLTPTAPPLEAPRASELVSSAPEPDDEVPTEAGEPVAEPIASSPSPAARAEELVYLNPAADREASGDEDDEADREDAAWSFARPSRFEEDELDMTAMVDVVFQLLIFFMVTASFSLQKSIEVPTPDQPKQGLAQALKPLEELQDVAILVAIDDRNGVVVDDDPLPSLADLADVLSDRMRRDQKSELILTSSRNASHRTVIAIIDAANKVGMQRIRMASAPPATD